MDRRALAPFLLSVVIAMAAVPSGSSMEVESQHTACITDHDVWLRMRGTKHTAPLTVKRDSTAIVVNGVRYEIEYDERSPARRIADGDYGEGEVYQYAAERIMLARGDACPVPAGVLEEIVAEANALLAAKGLPSIGLLINDLCTNAIVLHDGKDAGARVAIKVHRPFSRIDIARRAYEWLIGNLESDRSVVWGDWYSDSYPRERAVFVDMAIEAWIAEGMRVPDMSVGDGERVEISGMHVPRGLLLDLCHAQ